MYRTHKTYSILLLVAFLLLSSLSCNTNSNDTANELEASVVDSVNQWIRAGRNKTLDVESRLQQLKKAKAVAARIENDSLKLNYYSNLSLAYLSTPDVSGFRGTNAETLRLAQKIGDSVKQAEAHWDLAQFYRKKVVLDSSYYHFSFAEKLYSALGKDLESGKMLYNMAVSQADVKDNTGSEINTIRAIEVLKPLNKYKQLYSCYNNLASVTSDLKEYDRALEYYNTALDYQKKIEKENSFDLTLKNNIGSVYQEQGKYKEAISYFQQVLQDPGLHENNPKLYALVLNNLAYAKLKTGDKQGLVGQFEKAIEVFDSIGHVTGTSKSYYNLAEFYLDRKDTVQALIYAEQAREYAERASNNDRVLQTLQLLVKLEPEKSIAYNREYIALSDSLQQEERQVRNKFARIRFETDEFIAENELLEREKQLWTSIAVAVLLLGLMSYFIVDQRSKNQKLRFQQEQQAANQEIFNLMLAQNEKVEEGKKSEQKRISEELHDGVLGKMLGARMVLTGLNKKSDTDAEIQRKKAIDALQDVEKEVRAISHELSHAAYQKIHNFINSLEDLFKTVQNTGNFDYSFKYEETFDWDGLNGETKINVYRMIQESLQNCVKHAKCENVAVNLGIEKNGLNISVADDGKGFKTNTGKKGIGMRNITSRIDKLNGEWNIKSALGKGTTINFIIPLVCTKDNGTNPEEHQMLLKEV